MDLKLAGKTALVTGSTAGIGFAIANLLAQEGAIVVVNGRSKDRVLAACQRIKENHPNAKLMSVAADLTTLDGIQQMTQQAPTVDILVNNLGIYQVRPFFEISDDEWLHMFNVNVMSGVRLSRYYMQSMLKNNWGRIIFISSESGLQIPSEMIHYGMSKTAQLAIARGLAELTIGTNVTVNSVLPGPTKSEGVERFISDAAQQAKVDAKQLEKQFFETVRPTSLLKRFETIEEIAAMVAYLSSPLASGTNGAAIRVDGGVVRSIG